MIQYVYAIEGLADLKDLDKLDSRIQDAAQKAINATAPRVRAKAADRIRRQVNFPAGYLRGPQSRLKVTEYATPSKLAATVTGRQRPTSLARFVTGSKTPGKQNPTVTVKPGVPKTMRRAFLMKLRGGEEGNIGIAVRTSRGRMPDRAYKPVKISDNLYLVYGPSVDQVFRSVRQDVEPEAQLFLEAEFRRLLDLGL